MTAVGANTTITTPAPAAGPSKPTFPVASLAIAVSGAAGLAALAVAGAGADPTWQWLRIGLVVLAIGCAAPVLVAAGRDVARRRISLDVLATVALLASAGGVALAEADQRGWAAHAVVGVVAVLALATRVLVERAGASDTGTSVPPWYPPAVLGAGVLTGAAWLVADGPRAGLSAGTAVLVAGIGAIGVAAAAPLLASARAGARVGVRIRDAGGLEASRGVDLLVLDGLATVTEGQQVRTVEPFDDKYLRDLRWFAGALSHAAEDPAARAIAKLAPVRGNLSRVERLPGVGISGSVDRHPVRVGQPSWLGMPAVDADDAEIETVGVEVDLRLLGTITLADTVSDETAAAVADLASAGVATVLVTSARASRAAAVAERAGVPEVLAGDGTTVDTVGTVVGDRNAAGRRVAVLTTKPTAELPSALVIWPVAGDGADRVAEPAETVAVAEANVTHAAAALRLLRRAHAGVRRCRGIALAAHGVLIATAMAGVLSPPYAGLAALVVLFAVAAIGSVTVRGRGMRAGRR